MLKSTVFISLLLSSLSLYALDTRHVPTEQLLALGNALAVQAGSSQWQQLWQRVRQAGYLQARRGQAHFTVEQPQLPALARQTLAEATQVKSVGQTRTLYRRDFPGQVIGKRDETPLTALCLVVDWRTLPPSLLGTPHAYLQSSSLIDAYPCD
ncbi:hypothetical protein D3C79_377370 [compost metagenome]